MLKPYLATSLLLLSCNNAKDKLYLNGHYINQSDEYKQDLDFTFDSSVVFNLYPKDSAIIGSDCWYKFKKDTIFIGSVDQQSHKMYLTVSDTFLLVSDSSLKQVSTQTLFNKEI